MITKEKLPDIVYLGEDLPNDPILTLHLDSKTKLYEAKFGAHGASQVEADRLKNDLSYFGVSYEEEFRVDQPYSNHSGAKYTARIIVNSESTQNLLGRASATETFSFEEPEIFAF